EIYDLLGLARPDPFFALFIKIVDSLPPGDREEFKERIWRDYEEFLRERGIKSPVEQRLE
ncbi:MAG: hypothetical protein JW850_16750, partial [Thermoflexales bacterium]|nr:hypothetical protein [Thermoflexales bacterium]